MKRNQTWLLLVLLFAFGAVLYLTIVPGVFIADETNYLVNALALRDGHVSVTNTTGLTPSRELLFFDPAPIHRQVATTPVVSTAPPLYALFAWPFLGLKWKGLVLLNILAYLGTIYLVFWYTQKYADTSAAWLAAWTCAFGGFVLEYAQGVWPQALSIFLCTAGIVAAGRLIDGGRLTLAAVAGVTVGAATGVRYQNALFLGVVGLSIFVWSSRRWVSGVIFACGGAVPLAISALFNHARLGFWDPISKGPGYMQVLSIQSLQSPHPLRDAATMFWAKVVDFSARPPLVGPEFEPWVRYDAKTGAHMMLNITLQKSFLQSAPWAILAFLLMAVVWLPHVAIARARRRQLLLLSSVAFADVLLFSFTDVSRNEGLAFNQRYLLELMPIAAIAFAWSLADLQWGLEPLLFGILGGALLVSAILIGTPHVSGPENPLWLLRQWAILKLPLFLAVELAILWWLARRRVAMRRFVGALTGLCLGWGMALHIGDDLMVSRHVRAGTAMGTRVLAEMLPSGSAVIAYWGYRDLATPLLFDRDIVIVDARADEGADAPILIRELLHQHRRVFLIDEGFPRAVRSQIVLGLELILVANPNVNLLELHEARD